MRSAGFAGRRASPDHMPGVRFALVAIALILTAIGVLFVHSTRSLDVTVLGSDARGQILKAIVALVAFFLVSRPDYRLWERYAYVIYGGLIVFLAAMLAYSGDELRRAVKVVFFNVQPSELMKIGLVLCLARYLRYRRDQNRLSGVVVPLLLTVIPAYFVMRQPDLGTSLMLPPALLAMLFVSGARWRHVAFAISFAVLILPAVYFVQRAGVPIVKEYQFKRVEAFFERETSSRSGEGYQLHESQTAIGAGGVLGQGYTQGTQNRLDYVPARHTDFIFSIIAEETGFVGASFTILASFLLVFLMLRVALLTKEPFGRLVAVGLGAQFAAQAFQNMAMTVGLTPITGLTLPFVSHGGSSLVSSWIALGVVCSVARSRVQVVARSDLSPVDIPRSVPLIDDSSAAVIGARWPVG